MTPGVRIKSRLIFKKSSGEIPFELSMLNKMLSHYKHDVSELQLIGIGMDGAITPARLHAWRAGLSLIIRTVKPDMVTVGDLYNFATDEPTLLRLKGARFTKRFAKGYGWAQSYRLNPTGFTATGEQAAQHALDLFITLLEGELLAKKAPIASAPLPDVNKEQPVTYAGTMSFRHRRQPGKYLAMIKAAG